MKKVVELYKRFASDIDGVADVATSEWDELSRKYNCKIDEIKPKFPETVRMFLETVIAHDAKILLCDPTRLPFQIDFVQNNGWSSYIPAEIPFYCTVRYWRQGNRPSIKTQRHHGKAFQSKEAEWLYDQFDMIEDGLFRHDILYSDGTEINVIFTDFDFAISLVHN